LLFWQPTDFVFCPPLPLPLSLSISLCLLIADTCLQLQLACFDDPRIGGVGTEQRMRPIPRGTPGASWFRIGDATCWEIIADFRLTAKLLDNAASVWFGTSVSCLSGRTAAYRTCIVKPTAQQGPCNPKANRLFHVDKFGFRPEDYTSAQQLCTQLQHKLNRCEMFSDSLNAADIRQLVTHKNKLHPVAQRHGGQQPSASSDSGSRTASHSRDASNSDHEERKRDGAIEPGRCHNPAAVAHGHFAESAECSTSAASSFATAPPAPQYAMPESAAPIKCDSAAVADDFDAALSLVNSECQVRQLPTAPRVESRALPLLFFSFCIEFCNDYFIQPWDAAQLHSGDDKFLTRYITRRGWLMYTQTGDAAAIETTFKPNWRFLLQYMRWTRNTWRSDFRSLAKERAVWKSPHYWFLVFLMIDKCIAPFTLLFGPVLIFNVAMHSSLGLHATPDDADRPYRLPLWNVIASYVVWICLTRAFRIFPHFFRKPIHLLAIPFHVALQYLLAVLKIYCLFTLHVTDWGEKTHTHTHTWTRAARMALRAGTCTWRACSTLRHCRMHAPQSAHWTPSFISRCALRPLTLHRRYSSRRRAGSA
jgi:hypothetical protein